MDQSYAQYLLKKTIENYNLIAEDFSRTRRYVWPGFEFLAQYAKPNDNVLDLGCGNGRLLDLLRDKKINYIGIDNSSALIAAAQKRHPGADFRVGDALNLPFSDNYFDIIYSIAVLHHIPSEELRTKFLEEAKRVLKPGGILIITVWNLWQRRGLKYNLKYAVLKVLGLSKLDFRDVFVPWAKTRQRYFHCFSQKELKRLVESVGFNVGEIDILESAEKKGNNIYLVAQK
ncbi:MAG: class I SAM-dependent methyltransferase [Candidatus Portnoybacteria bacterium]|nr:class I SAM-dependent methyltransferase [Candidatus Portnoybacteria bacterium]